MPHLYPPRSPFWRTARWHGITSAVGYAAGFVEEPVPQENKDALAAVSRSVPFPIATGERLLSRWEFRELFEANAVAIIQPDVAHCGGITELKKIANMAEVYYVHTAPHCAIGPVAFSSCMQVARAGVIVACSRAPGQDRRVRQSCLHDARVGRR